MGGGAAEESAASAVGWLALAAGAGGSERWAMTSRTMPAAKRQPSPATRTLARKSPRDTLVAPGRQHRRHHVAGHRERGQKIPRLSHRHDADLEVLDHQQALGMLDPVERGDGVANAARH